MISKKKPTQTSLWEEPLVPASPSLDLEKDLEMIEETSPWSLYSWLIGLKLRGFSGKMSPVYCPQTKEGILETSLERWQNAGMGSPTGFLTLNLSEHNDFQERSHKDEGVSSLSDVLEAGEVPRRYYLTEKQCRGIIRRAEKNERALPENLLTALEEAINTFKMK